MPRNAVIELSRGYVAIIDHDDYDLIKDYKWHVKVHDGGRNLYAATNVRHPSGGRLANGKHRRTPLKMERLLLGLPPCVDRDVHVDHLNGVGLDNRRVNLRSGTQGDNNKNVRIGRANKSGVKGVHWHKQSSKWAAAIGYGGKSIFLGRFLTLEGAAEAYKEASLKYHGSLGRLK